MANNLIRLTNLLSLREALASAAGGREIRDSQAVGISQVRCNATPDSPGETSSLLYPSPG